MVLDLIGQGAGYLKNSFNDLLGQPSGDPLGIRGGMSFNTMYGGDPTGIRGGPSFGGGGDKFLGLVDQDRAAIYNAQQAQSYGTPGMGYSGGGMAGVAGGNWAALDVHNNEINTAASKFGVPANLLKSMINRESSGNWGGGGSTWVRDPNAPGGGFNILPFVGMKEATAKSLGLDFWGMQGNKQAQIDSMAQLMSNLASQYGGYENAVKVYFGGQQALQPGGYTDVNNMTSSYYYQQAIQGWKDLDARSGAYGGDTRAGYSNVAGGSMNNPSDVVNTAMSYVNNAPYIWGSIPGAAQDPSVTGWDCSGMISWLSSKFAPGSGLPNGSHYQYEWAKSHGLFMDAAQLRPGDIVFFDTGSRSGGGANLNGASHVGMYIGNGKIVHAANPTAGTIISDLAAYQGMYQYLGAAHMPWSGGGAGFNAGYYQGQNQPASGGYDINEQMRRAMLGLPY